MLRRAYIRTIPVGAWVLSRSGLDRFFARSNSFWLRHFWSLFALYDVERMLMFGKPWWVYDAIDEVERFLEERGGKARVFEYGAGSSTAWLAERAAEVRSVEHDGAFVEVVRPIFAEYDNVELRHVGPAPRRPDSVAVSGHSGDEDSDFAEYVDSINRVGGEFDLIIVDGRARVDCLEAAVDHLAPGGLLLFDDAGRARYRGGLERSPLDVDIRKGLGPSTPWPETTGLLRAKSSVTAS